MVASASKNERAVEALVKVIVRYGRRVAHDPRLLENLLKDRCPDCKREIHVLVSAAKERVPEELLQGERDVPLPILLERHVQRLRDNLGLSASVARWAVNVWAAALGLFEQYDPAPAENDAQPLEPLQPTEPTQRPTSSDTCLAVPPEPTVPTVDSIVSAMVVAGPTRRKRNWLLRGGIFLASFSLLGAAGYLTHEYWFEPVRDFAVRAYGMAQAYFNP